MIPGSPEWAKLITASKVAAILGVSPWESPRSTWLLMHGDIVGEESNEQQRRGHYLEPAILAWWRDQHRDYTAPMPHPDYLLGDWAAATPDAVAIWGGSRKDAPYGQERVLVEAKSTADDGDWGEPGTDEIPDYYLVQVYWQMHVSGVHRCYVPVIGPRLKFVEYVVDYDERYGQALERTMRKFYDSLAADEPPPLDDTVATWNAVRRVHKDIDRGVSVELTEDEATRLVTENDIAKITEPRLRGARSAVVDRMGRAQYATYQGVRIARRQPRGEETTFVVVAKPADLPKQEEPAA